VEQEKSRKFGSSQDHGLPMMPVTDRGMIITMASSFSFGCVAENARVLLYKLVPQQQKKRSISLIVIFLPKILLFCS